MTERRCQNCGAALINKPTRAKFCSRSCSGASRQYALTCEYCGSEFRPTRGKRQRFCSQQCNGKAHANPDIARENARRLVAKDPDYFQKLSRAAAVARQRKPKQHGYHRYKQGCRCNICMTAAAQNPRGSRQVEAANRRARYAEDPEFRARVRARAKSPDARAKRSQARARRYREDAAYRETVKQLAKEYREQNAERYLQSCEKWRQKNPDKVRSQRLIAQYANDASRDSATNHRCEWTGPELEIVATRTDLTARELAAALGRTIAAVRAARHRVRREPREMVLAGRTRIK